MEKKEKGNKGKVSESYVAGVIALAFLILGYQTAMFVHRAAVAEIVANRDEPDTVIVYRELPVTGSVMDLNTADKDIQIKGMVGSQKTVERKNSAHSPVAEVYRKTAPRRNVESFRFDPNNVTEDQLCRLGFSQKQAQSIINYRAKGGRFRRKEDFAKSYVVSDSVFRRLEPYIDIPLLDLNLADSAAFDSLPGIGGWFASKMVGYRTALRGYSKPEQLMEIKNFTREKFDALSDLVTVSPENVRPYPLWTHPADSLKLHPYIKSVETANAIVLFRNNNPKSSWTLETLLSAGVITHESYARLASCFISSP